MGLIHMLFVLGTLASLVAYAGGLFIVMKVTPLLLSRRYDEGLFMGIAGMDILGSILSFAAVMVSFALLNGTQNMVTSLFGTMLLVGIFLIPVRMSLCSFRPLITTRSVLVAP